MDLGGQPRSVGCPHCKAEVTTSLKYNTGTFTHIVAVLLCGVFCCCIPYCVDSCKDVDHECPCCGRLIGSYRRV